MGLPALAPMDQHFEDGDFVVETKAIDLPDFDFDTLFEED